MSCVTSDVSHVTCMCHMSCVTCHVSHVTSQRKEKNSKIFWLTRIIVIPIMSLAPKLSPIKVGLVMYHHHPNHHGRLGLKSELQKKVAFLDIFGRFWHIFGLFFRTFFGHTIYFSWTFSLFFILLFLFKYHHHRYQGVGAA